MREVMNGQFECDFKGFARRILYKMSGQKIITFLVASVTIIGFVFVRKSVDISDEIVLKGIDTIKVLALTLMGVKGVQNIVGIVKNGDSNGRE